MISRRPRGGLLALVLAGGVITLIPAGVQGQATSVILQACKKIAVHVGAGGYFGDRLNVSECGTRFSAQDRYVALLVTVRWVRDPTDIGIQLLDPSESVLWAQRSRVNPPPDTVYESYWIFGVLPLAADLRSLAHEHVTLAASAIQFPGRPARERPGTWSLRVSLNRGRVQELRFVVEDAPAPAPSPSPTSSP